VRAVQLRRLHSPMRKGYQSPLSDAAKCFAAAFI
jgi:hypothetical protein